VGAQRNPKKSGTRRGIPLTPLLHTQYPLRGGRRPLFRKRGDRARRKLACCLPKKKKKKGPAGKGTVIGSGKGTGAGSAARRAEERALADAGAGWYVKKKSKGLLVTRTDQVARETAEDLLAQGTF